MLSKKLKTQQQIIRLVRNFRKQGKKIVTYNGSFDILHLGHVKSLQEAKKQGDVLIVPLNSDKSIKAYKSPKRPIIPQSQRAQMLSALSCVDYVVIFDETNPIKILDKIKPDIHCNGADYGQNCIEKDVVKKNGGKIHILKWLPGLSTTKIIKKILNVYSSK